MEYYRELQEEQLDVLYKLIQDSFPQQAAEYAALEKGRLKATEENKSETSFENTTTASASGSGSGSDDDKDDEDDKDDDDREVDLTEKEDGTSTNDGKWQHLQQSTQNGSDGPTRCATSSSPLSLSRMR